MFLIVIADLLEQLASTMPASTCSEHSNHLASRMSGKSVQAAHHYLLKAATLYELVGNEKRLEEKQVIGMQALPSIAFLPTLIDLSLFTECNIWQT